MPRPCITPEDALAAAVCVFGGKAAIKSVLTRLNAADEKELATLRARIGAQDEPEPDPGGPQHS